MEGTPVSLLAFHADPEASYSPLQGRGACISFEDGRVSRTILLLLFDLKTTILALSQAGGGIWKLVEG